LINIDHLYQSIEQIFVLDFILSDKTSFIPFLMNEEISLVILYILSMPCSYRKSHIDNQLHNNY